VQEVASVFFPHSFFWKKGKVNEIAFSNSSFRQIPGGFIACQFPIVRSIFHLCLLSFSNQPPDYVPAFGKIPYSLLRSFWACSLYTVLSFPDNHVPGTPVLPVWIRHCHKASSPLCGGNHGTGTGNPRRQSHGLRRTFSSDDGKSCSGKGRRFCS